MSVFVQFEISFFFCFCFVGLDLLPLEMSIVGKDALVRWWTVRQTEIQDMSVLALWFVGGLFAKQRSKI
jgi:hypothetical protein